VSSSSSASRAVARDLVDKSGNHLSFAGSPLGNGRERSRDAVGSNGELPSTLRQAIVAAGPVRPGRRVEAEAEEIGPSGGADWVRPRAPGTRAGA